MPRWAPETSDVDQQCIHCGQPISAGEPYYETGLYLHSRGQEIRGPRHPACGKDGVPRLLYEPQTCRVCKEPISEGQMACREGAVWRHPTCLKPDRREYAAYDINGVVCGIVLSARSPSTQEVNGILCRNFRLLERLSEDDQQRIREIVGTLRQADGTGKRRRAGGHGYSGGDGFVDLR